MSGVVKGLDHVMASMDLEKVRNKIISCYNIAVKISGTMDKFERLFADVDTHTEVTNRIFDRGSCDPVSFLGNGIHYGFGNYTDHARGSSHGIDEGSSRREWTGNDWENAWQSSYQFRPQG